jgi:hypothetical protein
LSEGTPDESVQTLPLESTICVADGTTVPLADGEPALAVVLPVEAGELPVLAELPEPDAPPDVDELVVVAGALLLPEELADPDEPPDVEELVVVAGGLLLPEELPESDEPPDVEELVVDDNAAVTPVPGEQAGKPPTGAAAVPVQPPETAAPYCVTYQMYH